MDFLKPNYPLELSNRAKLLMKLRKDPKMVGMMKAHYACAPWDFVKDWGHDLRPA